MKMICLKKCSKAAYDSWTRHRFSCGVEITQHPDFAAANYKLSQLLSAGDSFAITPQVLAEFVHVVSDKKRFGHPLDMTAAFARAEYWWTAAETIQLFPDDASVRQFLDWMKLHTLGRKRVLDTMLAATLFRAGVSSVLTTNAKDFNLLGPFSVITPATP